MSPGDQRYTIRFAEETRKELRRLGPSAGAEILAAIRKKLSAAPEAYGEALGRDLAGYRKLTVGQWRVAYHVETGKSLVLVLAIGKRAAGDHENIYDQLGRDNLDARADELRRGIDREVRHEKPR